MIIPVKEKEDTSLIQKFKIPRKYIISYDTEKKYTWDIFVVALAVLSGFLVPLELAFKPYFTQETWFITMNYFIDFLFLVDLILGFFTSFINKKGFEEMDSAKILERQIGKVLFYTDFLSICGNSLFQKNIN